jgi:ADP-heptose:LPS heptosyltransferase
VHQYRWKIGSQQYRHSNSRLLEDISNVKNKKVLVWHEQGLGDTVMFSRYVPKLVDLGAIVVFEVQEDLKLFFKNQFNCEINNEVSAKEFFDFQVPLLDLPKLFNTSTKTIPYNRPYLSVQDKKKEWKEKLQLSKNRLNIGISVSGQPNHKRNHIRSLSLKTMEPILQEANFFLIQKELNDEDKKFLNNHKKINFLGDEINNFLDTAAIVSNMDLIISIDTSLIHLAGAIGKKSFLMLSYSADWRWLLDQNKTPWYENIKIFRQDSIGNWDFVINQIQDEFNKLKINKI